MQSAFGKPTLKKEFSLNFYNLFYVAKQLEECGVLRRDVTEHWRNSRKNAKQYLKLDYKVFKRNLTWFCGLNLHDLSFHKLLIQMLKLFQNFTDCIIHFLLIEIFTV